MDLARADDFLLDQCAQPAVDRASHLTGASRFQIAWQLLTAAGVCAAVAVTLWVSEGKAMASVVLGAPLWAVCLAITALSIRRAERNARPGAMNPARAMHRESRMLSVLSALGWSAWMVAGVLGPDRASAPELLLVTALCLDMAAQYALACEASPPPARTAPAGALRT